MGAVAVVVEVEVVLEVALGVLGVVLGVLAVVLGVLGVAVGVGVAVSKMFEIQLALMMLILPFLGAVLGSLVQSNYARLTQKSHQGIAAFSFLCIACDEEFVQSTLPMRAEFYRQEEGKWEDWFICDDCLCKTIDGPILMVNTNASN